MALVPVTAFGQQFTSAEVTFLQGIADHSYTDGQLLIGNGSTGGLSIATLTQGSGVTITNGHGTITIASTGGGGTPGGSDTQVQFNDGGTAFGGNAGLTFNKTTDLTSAIVTDSGTNNNATPFKLSHLTSGTATAGFGTILQYEAQNASGSPVVIGSIAVAYTTATAGSETAKMTFFVDNGGMLNGGAQLTTLFFGPSGASNIALGSTSNQFSNLFMSTGSTLNFVNGNVVITHSSGILTMGTGDLRVTTAGSNTASVVTVGGTQTLTNKDLTSGTNTFPTFNQNTTGSAAKLTTGRTIAITGDLAYTSPSFDGSGNVTAAGTLATVNSNVGSFGSATAAPTFTVNGKGLITAAGTNTITPAVGSITGLGSGIATFLATPSSANLASAVTDETGSGALVFGTSPTLTTAILGSSTATTQSPSDNSTKVATTAYVDAAVLGQNFKEAALVATTANLVGVYLSGVFTYTASGVDTIDGVSLALGNRVLVKNQSTTFQNGIYSVTTAGALGVAGVLTRTSDANTSGEFKTGDSIFITSGTANSNTTWAYTGVDSPTIGTDAITYAQTAGQGTVTAGNGIAVTGLSVAIDTSVTVDKTTAQTLTNKTLTTPVINGTITGTGQATAATASTIVMRDASANISVNNTLNGYTTTVTSSTPVVLTIGSTYYQWFTGSTAQTVTMPVVSTLPLGTSYYIVNISSAAVTVQSSGSNTIFILGSGGSAIFSSIATTGTTAGVWSPNTFVVGASSGKIANFNNSLTLAGTDATTMTFPSTSATLGGLGITQTWTGPNTFNNIIDANNAITASGNAATVPVTFRVNTVTNNSAATLTITLTTSGAANRQMVMVCILDSSAAAQTITWVNTENSTVSVPTTSNGSTTLPLTVGFQFNNATSKWRCIASA